MKSKAIATLGLAFALSMPMLAFAQETDIDQKVSEIFGALFGPFVSFIFYSVPIAGVSFPLIVGWLIICAIVLTVKMGFIQFTGVKHSIELLRGVYSNPDDAGEVSHFQALATALSGTVGLGNIAGVAVAVSLGGPGATFWMIMAGLFGMVSKFTECTLGVKYRTEFPDGHVSGGPMYYLSKGLANQGKPVLGKVLAVLFAIMCIFGALGGGNMFQGNQAHQMFANTFGIFTETGWLFGLILAVIVGAVIIGGIKSIAKVTEKIVPLMAAIYVGTALIILFANFSEIPTAIGVVFQGAFAPEAVGGGIVGVLIQGLKRASFSNEAGVGSAAIAHSAVRTREPLTEGYVALLEPFIDTVVICTMTALVIVITGAYTNAEGLGGVALTASAFQSVFPWFGVVLSIAVLLFAFSTMISWSYYGLKCWTYLFGEGQVTELIYKFIFCVFVVIGCSMSLGPVIDFSDAAIFAMSIANVLGLYMLMGEVRRDLSDYQARLKSGEIKRYK
ncbi:MAG: alanine:cation symporter family protein [Gammaproteobacteria bacterium]|nr:alanine:cation symporter family protein [Gammaproteobacteria bacterium]MDH3466266.1 alanine:cation symporter family protein [Gammaproteobacteria bacterium]